eukprot:scpid11392/ scgid15799/ 5&apos; Protein Dhm2; Strand-exchange protein 1 homolog
MGVPKFYRWLSERFPLLSQVVKEHQIPEFDNLYLDMNGIVHVCSHPNDDDPHFRITEEKIFEAIFHYIEFLFRIIKPREVFFMAIDGVAPRAKMNQQRGRRFRSAHEAATLEEEARKKGEKLPDAARFDSNCITPGTPFMVRLQDQLKYFISKKISTDRIWKKVRVVLSGHEVPGEGEHKIMDFIRHEKSQPGYNPNTRHCLYGLDADLMMLGLASHEPHFALLREEVVFGRKAQRRSTTAEETTFHLLHLSLLREYLYNEFKEVKDKLDFEFDLERIIDDWILMGFLVGNDFIPHLPYMHINEDALPVLWNIYIEILPQLTDYLHLNGTINLHIFKTFLEALSKWQFDYFQEQLDDDEYLKHKQSEGGFKSKRVEEKKAQRRKHRAREVEQFSDEEAPSGTNSSAALLDADALDDFEPGAPIGNSAAPTQDADETASDGTEGAVAAGPSSAAIAVFDKKRRDYYSEKLYESEQAITKEQLHEMCQHYIRGIQWILLYYYHGVPSWSWYFPYHYSPFLHDVVENEITETDVSFELGTPFLPFQQLLAVLPSLSKELLPEAFQYLMTSPSSEIIEFYPVKFKSDLNGKKQDWEAVVLIPFIDQDRLVAAMSSREELLESEEKRRNRHGKCFVYTYDKSISFTYASPQQLHPPIKHCTAKEEKLPANSFSTDPDNLIFGLCDGVMLDVVSPGFPTLKHLPHRTALTKAGVRIFQQASRNSNMIVHLCMSDEGATVEVAAKELIGKNVFVNFPFLVEAQVISVMSDAEVCSELTADGQAVIKEQSGEGNSKFFRDVDVLTEEYSSRKGLEVGVTDVLLCVNVCEGERFVCDSKTGKISLEKQWSKHPSPICYQTIVKDIPTLRQARAAASAANAITTEDIEEVDSAGGSVAAASDDGVLLPTLNELFPMGAKCFVLSGRYYGAAGKIENVELNKQVRIHVQVEQHEEPSLLSAIRSHKERAEVYVPLDAVAREAGISTGLLARIVSSLKVERPQPGGSIHKFDVGLQLKSTNKGTELVGFARGYLDATTKKWRTWELSPLAVSIVKDYVKKFPTMFQRLEKMTRNDDFQEKDVFGEVDSAMQVEVLTFLRQVASASGEQLQCGSCTLDASHIEDIDRAVQQAKAVAKSKKRKILRMQVRPNALFMPPEYFNNLRPDPEAEFHLWDRVVNVRSSGAVPLGCRGTVVGIYEPLGSLKEEEHEMVYEVFFDEEFHGGLKLRSSGKRCYRMMAASLISLSHGQRTFSNSKQATAAATASDETMQAALSSARASAERKAALKAPQPYDRRQQTPTRRLYNPMQQQPRGPSSAINHSAFVGRTAASVVAGGGGAGAGGGRPGNDRFSTPVGVRQLQPKSAASAPAQILTGASQRHHPAAAQNPASPILSGTGNAKTQSRSRSDAKSTQGSVSSTSAAVSSSTKTTTTSTSSAVPLLPSSQESSTGQPLLSELESSLKTMLNIGGAATVATDGASKTPSKSAPTVKTVVVEAPVSQTPTSKTGGASHVGLLRLHCKTKKLGVPTYEISHLHSKYTAMLNIEQMWFEGDPALSQAKACESAAGKALSSLHVGDLSAETNTSTVPQPQAQQQQPAQSIPASTSAPTPTAAVPVAPSVVTPATVLHPLLATATAMAPVSSTPPATSPSSEVSTMSAAEASPAVAPAPAAALMPALLQQLNHAAMQTPSGKLGPESTAAGSTSWDTGPFATLFGQPQTPASHHSPAVPSSPHPQHPVQGQQHYPQQHEQQPQHQHPPQQPQPFPQQSPQHFHHQQQQQRQHPPQQSQPFPQQSPQHYHQQQQQQHPQQQPRAVPSMPFPMVLSGLSPAAAPRPVTAPHPGYYAAGPPYGHPPAPAVNQPPQQRPPPGHGPGIPFPAAPMQVNPALPRPQAPPPGAAAYHHQPPPPQQYQPPPQQQHQPPPQQHHHQQQ